MQEMEETSACEGLCDDAIMEILVRLPSESVLRCRTVCKRWRRITTGRSFLAAHSARRPREMIVYTPSLLVSAIPLPWFLDPADTAAAAGAERRGGFLCDIAQRDKNGAIRFPRLLYSLDGLIVLEEENRSYVVCNPVTRQWTNLPALVPKHCFAAYPCGFYLHSSSGEYRLLCHGDGRPPPGPGDCGYYILVAGGTEPRRLCRAPKGNPIINRYESPMAHADILYWFCMHPDSERTDKMLAFDTASETFRLMARPPGVTQAALLELDGSLCAATITCTQPQAPVVAPSLLDVWVLQDHNPLLDVWVLQDHDTAESWTLRHRVRLVLSPWSISDSGTFPPVSRAISAGDDDVSSSSSILIGHNTFPVVILCDLKEKRVRGEFHCESTPSFLVFHESLVSHDFFQLPCCSKLMSINFPDSVQPTQEESTQVLFINN